MEKRGDNLELEIKQFAQEFLKASEDQETLIISHNDTDGISSGSIMIKTLEKLDKKFSIKIIRTLEAEFIETLPENKTLLFLDLASNNLDDLAKRKNKSIFILDHHEITQEIPSNIKIINPHLHAKQKISGSSITYLFAKELHKDHKELAKLAILGMIGDLLEKEIDRLNHNILTDGEIKRKRGLLIYPSTRPLTRTLEYSSNPYIPGVTGNIQGVLELLRECGLAPVNGKYKSILELEKEETSRLLTAIMLRTSNTEDKPLIGDIFLIKHYNKLEDARELSAKINACSRMGEPATALMLCMEIPKAKKRAESIHVKYRQHIISGLKHIDKNKKIQGNQYVIINAKDKIKDTLIGTMASILSFSSVYKEGTVIITMAYNEDKIKVSTRMAGRKSKTSRNLKELMDAVTHTIGGEAGGHKMAAGCTIKKQDEEKFIDLIKNKLEVEMVKI